MFVLLMLVPEGANHNGFELRRYGVMQVFNEYMHAESINKVAKLNEHWSDKLGFKIKSVKEHTFANESDRNTAKTMIESMCGGHDYQYYVCNKEDIVLSKIDPFKCCNCGDLLHVYDDAPHECDAAVADRIWLPVTTQFNHHRIVSINSMDIYTTPMYLKVSMTLSFYNCDDDQCQTQ